MRPRKCIELPWDLTHEMLRLEPGAIGKTADEEMGFIVDEVSWESDELERIMRGAVALFQHQKDQGNSVTFGECLHTSIVWERG